MEYIQEAGTVIGTLTTVVISYWKWRSARKERSSAVKRPTVVVTKGGTPPSHVGLCTEDGAQFPVNPHNGLAEPSANYVASLIFVRDLKTKKELARFILQRGLNEINI